MSSSAGSIDVSRLEKELVSALEADRKYSRENDAKFRAVHQKVATYEEFRFDCLHMRSKCMILLSAMQHVDKPQRQSHNPLYP